MLWPEGSQTPPRSSAFHRLKRHTQLPFVPCSISFSRSVENECGSNTEKTHGFLRSAAVSRDQRYEYARASTTARLGGAALMAQTDKMNPCTANQPTPSTNNRVARITRERRRGGGQMDDFHVKSLRPIYALDQPPCVARISLFN